MGKNPYFKSHWIGISWEVDHAGEQNKYYAFRKEYYLNGKINKAFIRITADSRFILFINDTFIGRGPARCYPEKQAFETYDVKNYLKKGSNCISVLVHRFGTSTGQYVNRGRTGLLIYGEIEIDRGDYKIIKTDLSWKVREANWFLNTRTRLTCQLGFQEIYDARNEPPDWKRAGFDEKKYGWKKIWFIGPAGIHPWIDLEPSDLKPLDEEEIKGKYFFTAQYPNCKDLNINNNVINCWIDNSYKRVDIPSPNKEGWISVKMPENKDLAISLDYGFVFAGYPLLELKDAPSGAVIDIFYHTSLDDNNIPIPDRGFGTSWEGLADRFICEEGNNMWKPYFYKGFRFFTCVFRGFKEIKLRLRAIETHYPIEEKGEFYTSDKLFDIIWNVSVRTLKSTMLDAHVDNPWREQGQWLFDGIAASLGATSSFGNSDLIRRGFKQWGNSIAPEGFLNCMVPSELNLMSVTDYSFEWVRGLWLYYLYTGDTSLLKDCLETLKSILENSNRLTTEEDLFIPPEGYQYFIDWADIDRRHYGFTLNTLLLQAYDYGVLILKELREDSEVEKNKKRGQKLRKILENKFWSKSSRCWREHLPPNERIEKVLRERIQPLAWPQEEFLTRKCTGIGSLHGNVMALSLKLGNKNQQKGALDYVKKAFNEDQNEVNFFSPIWTEKVFGTLFKSGAGKEAIQYIRKLLGKEIEMGATTWPESFYRARKLVRSMSNWPGAQEDISCINYIFHHYILGVYPIMPGFKKFVFKPCIENLEFAKGIIPSPLGDFEINCYKKNRVIVGDIKVPNGTSGVALGTRDGNIKIGPGKSTFLWKEEI